MMLKSNIISECREIILNLLSTKHEKELFSDLKEFEEFVLDTAYYALQQGNETPQLPDEINVNAFQDKRKSERKKLLDTLLAKSNQIIENGLVEKKFSLVSKGADYQTIYNAGGKLEAESIKLFLISLGFPAKFYQESAGVAYGITVGPMGLAEVMVPIDDLDQAKEVLKAMEAGVFIIEDDQTDLFDEFSD